jgi:diguanylate cyclase (GGDEF)-like protein
MMLQRDSARVGRRHAGAGSSGRWRTVIDRLLALQADVIADSELAVGACLSERIDACRRAVAADAPTAAIDPLLEECADLWRQTLAGMRGERLAQKREIAALVTLVREALSAVAGDTRAFAQSLDQSVERFEQLVRVDDDRDLKQQLVIEVQILRHTAAERNRSWRKTCEQFSRRVETLEQQLTASRREATLDPLTRIPNRAAFEATGREWLATGRRRFILALVDVDNLKIVNDEYGHAAGDRAILAVARALTASVRAGSDVVARIGGDEFGVLAADLPLQHAESRMQRLIGSLTPENDGDADRDTPRELTLSCGIAECSAGDTLESLTERADVALYQAKRLGGNRVVSVVKPTRRSVTAQ